VKLVEFMNSLSGTSIVRQSTFSDISGDLTMDLDFGNDPFSAPFNLIPGTILTNLVLYLKQTSKTPSNSHDGPTIGINSVIIESVPISLVVDGKIGIKANYKGAGNGTSAIIAAAAGWTPPTTVS